jgi:nuclear transport factor 2 (NTF2) superfamily protein/acetylornithine deacetylase/succinyl-diaminopimelate desuccinylase-like protein
MSDSRPPFPPFTAATAAQKVQGAEDAWNTTDPVRVSLAYSEDSIWRNRDLFLSGRAEIVAFLTQKWERELEYALRKNLWAFEGNRIGVRFQYESHDADGGWWRSYGNELWEFNEAGLMVRREASINDVRIAESDRRIFGPAQSTNAASSSHCADVPAWFDELAEFLRIPSVSADDARGSDVRRAGEWVCELIRAAGGESDLVDWLGQPLAIGELRACKDHERAPTVLCYGHFDVQPPDPLALWESPPFEPELRGEYVYGRGVADDKGQLYMLLAAARGLAEARELPVNVRFACDGEEETGGNSIVEFLEADERGADVAVIFDSAMIRRGLPAFNIATRGLVYFHVALSTGERDLHSGLYGGAALNAAHALIGTLGAVLATDGRLAEPLRAGVLPPSEDELESWRELPTGADELGDQGARPMDARAAEEFYVRTFAEPALDVNGIESGSPHLQKTVLPVGAVANVSIRLAPGQQVEEIATAFERLLRDATPDGVELEVELLSAAPPAVVPPDARAVQLGLDAFERVIGVRPALIRSGGTLPIVAALADRTIATIVTGFSLPDANIHSPNERLVAEYVPLGIAAARACFQQFRSLRQLQRPR